MTERQKRFVEYYIESGNARQAAIRAGYSEGYAEHVKRQKGVKAYLAKRLGGMDEYRYGKPDGKGLFSEDDGYRILLSHYPILPDCACPPDLMLSGHTHGGQFNLLGLTPYAIGFERIGRLGYLAPVMVSGFERFGRTALLVGKGIGASRIPLRVGVRPEIYRIVFC